MNDPTIILTCDTALIDEALDLLSDIAQTSHEVVQGFLGFQGVSFRWWVLGSKIQSLAR